MIPLSKNAPFCFACFCTQLGHLKMAATGSTQNPDQEPRPDGEDCWRPSILSLGELH